MVDRLIEFGGLKRADYVLVDTEPAFLAEVDALCARWKTGATRNTAPTADVSIAVSTHQDRLEDWLATTEEVFDLIIVHAVLDLVDVHTALPLLLNRLADGGILWTTINFDGETIFMPMDARDGQLLDAYHRSMDERVGSSTAGRALFGHIRESGGVIVRAGSSDWVVFSDGSGYVDDEAYFVHHIIHTIEEELCRRPGLSEIVADWAQLRHRQVEAGELVYIAHQLDFAIRR